VTSLRAVLAAVAVVVLAGCGTNPDAIRSRADALYEQAAYADAELQYRKLIAVVPENGDAHFRLGITF
jgi:uncharacterized lipoprotein